MGVKLKEFEDMRICPSGHEYFYQIIEGKKEYCMICYALGFVHQFEKIKDNIIDTKFGKMVKNDVTS